VHPMEAGAVAAGPALDVVVRNGYAFLGTSYGGLRVIDVREPAGPAEVAAVHPSTNGILLPTAIRSCASDSRETGYTPCGPREAHKGEAVSGFCASPHPAPWPIRSRNKASGTLATVFILPAAGRRHSLKPTWNRFLALSA
jgi:hypothetical protein